MILVDTSAWVEFLRGTGSETHVRVRAYHDLTTELAITDVVAMELLAGIRNVDDERRLELLVDGLPLLRTQSFGDFEYAAELYRTCRQAGETVRKLDDCVIAAVAIRNGVAVLHRDADFDVLARHTPLQIA